MIFLANPPDRQNEKMTEICDWDDQVITNGLYYKKFTDVPFTGEVTGEEQGKLKDGKRDGPWVSYYDNGQVWRKGTFKNGKRDGPWIDYHDNGQLWSKGTYKVGKEDGPWFSYKKDGTVWEEWTGTYRNGVKVE